MASNKLRELPRWARIGIVALGATEVGLLAAAQLDITRRPVEQIRGGKPLWRLVSLLNIVGPLAYYRWGRIRPGSPSGG